MRLIDHSKLVQRVGADGVPVSTQPNPPLSDAPATPEELEASDRLMSFLSDVDPLETEAEVARRTEVIDDLTEIVREWIRGVCLAKGMAEDEAAEVLALFSLPRCPSCSPPLQFPSIWNICLVRLVRVPACLCRSASLTTQLSSWPSDSTFASVLVTSDSRTLL